MLYLDECPNCGAPRGKKATSCPYCGTSLLNMIYLNEGLGQDELFDKEESRISVQEELQGVKDVIVSKAVPHKRWDRTVLIVSLVLLGIGTVLATILFYADFDGGKLLAGMIGAGLVIGFYFCIGELNVCTRSLQAAEQDPTYKSTVAMIGERIKVASINPDGREFRELVVVADIRGRKTCVNILVEDGSYAQTARRHPIGSKLTIGGSGEYFVAKVG